MDAVKTGLDQDTLALEDAAIARNALEGGEGGTTWRDHSIPHYLTFSYLVMVEKLFSPFLYWLAQHHQLVLEQQLLVCLIQK